MADFTVSTDIDALMRSADNAAIKTQLGILSPEAILNPLVEGQGLLNSFRGSAAAYSLRDLNKTNPDVVEVRRASDETSRVFKANEIGSTLENWVGTGATDHGYVATWYDQSGNGNNATQPVSTSQPKIVDAGVLVADGIQFDGVDDYIDTPVIPNRNTFSFLSVFKINTHKDYNSIFTNSAGPNLWEMWGNSSGGFSVRSAGSDFQIDLVDLSTSMQVSSICINTSQAQLFKDGLLRGSDTTRSPSATTPAQLALGGGNGNTTLDGSISEVIIYNSDQSAFRTNIEFNINNAYSIY